MPTLGEGDLPTDATGHPALSSGVALGSPSARLYVGEARVYAAVGSQVAAEAPDAPTITNTGSDLIVSGGAVEIFFTAPVSDNGAPVIDYKVYVDGTLVPNDDIAVYGSSDWGDSNTVELVELRVSLDGLTVTVSAVNAVGEGPQSNSITLSY